MPTYSEWARRKSTSAYTCRYTKPLPRYSATDSRCVVSLEQSSLVDEEAELQKLLRELDAKVELQSANEGNCVERCRLVQRRHKVNDRLGVVSTRKEQLVNGINEGRQPVSPTAMSYSTFKTRMCKIHTLL